MAEMTLKAGATNEVSYALPTAVPEMTATLYDQNGRAVTSGVAVYDSGTYTLSLAVSVPYSAVNSKWSVIWSWEEGDHEHLETEFYSVVYGGLGSLLPRLRLSLRDKGAICHDYFIGDGIRSDFQLTSFPVKQNSWVLTGNKTYTIDTSSGVVQFSTAPAANESIKATYVYNKYTDSDLLDYLETAVAEGAVLTGLNIPADDTIEKPVRDLVVALAVRAVYTDEAADAARGAFSWSDEEKTINKSGQGTSYTKALEALDTKIGKLVRAINDDNLQGRAMSGGKEPLGYGSVEF